MSKNINIRTNENQQEQKKKRQNFQKKRLWLKLSPLNEIHVSDGYLLGDLNGSNREKYYNNVLKVIGDKLYVIYKDMQSIDIQSIENKLGTLQNEFGRINRTMLQSEQTIDRLFEVNKQISELKTIKKKYDNFDNFSNKFIEMCYEKLEDGIHNQEEIENIVDGVFKSTENELF